MSDNQVEAWRLCDKCSGLGRIESQGSRMELGASSRGPDLCLLIPRHACEDCRREAEEQAARASRAGRRIRVLDGDAALKDRREPR